MHSTLAAGARTALNLVLTTRLRHARRGKQHTRAEQALPQRQITGPRHHGTAFKNLAATSTAGVEVSPLRTSVANARSPR